MADLLLTISRRLQPPCAAFLLVAALQVAVQPAAPRASPGVRGALVAAQTAPERS